MEVNTCLSIYKDKINTALFKADYSFPYFWVCLLDHEIIESKVSDWLEPATYLDANLREEEVSLINHDILITKEQLVTNSSKHKPFIAEYYPDLLPLYEDFINNLTYHLGADTFIRLDIHEFIWSFKNQEDFITEITKEVHAITHNINTNTEYITQYNKAESCTGYATEYNEAFEDLPSYQNANTIDWEDNEITEPERSTQNTRLKTIFICSIIMLIAIILSMMIN